MKDVEILLYALTGAMGSVVALCGVVWKILRDESKGHAAGIKLNAENISNKASLTLLTEAEVRWKADLKAVRKSNTKLIEKLELRHDKELEKMAENLGEQIRTTESNILVQIRLMIEAIESRDRGRHTGGSNGI